MASTFTTNKSYEKQGTGENSNTWGTKLNATLDIIDSNVGGNLSISVAGNSNVTPTSTQAENLVHELTGALTGNISYILPTAGGFYYINNQTTGAFTVTVKTSGGTGVVCPQGYVTEVYCDGANFNYADSTQQVGNQVWVVAGGSADALTATYSPPVTVLQDGMELRVRAANANATTTPTFAPNGLTAHTITKLGGTALVAGDIAGNLYELILRYNLANTRWELLNPALIVGTETVNPQTGTTYTVVAGDKGKLVTFTNASAIAVTQPQATGSFASGWWADFACLSGSAGAATITPTTSTIDGGSTLVLNPGEGARVVSDGTNYQITRAKIVLATNSQALGGTDTTHPVTSAGLASVQNLAATAGHTKYPGGFIENWGAVTFNNASSASPTFDLGFPNACFGAVANSNSTANPIAVTAKSISGLTLASAATFSGTVYYRAWGN